MLSDRIKKFGLQSNTEQQDEDTRAAQAGAPTADNAESDGAASDGTEPTARQTDSAENATEQAKQVLRDAFKRAEAERSDAAEQYVAQKLEGSIHRPAPRVHPADSDGADGADDSDAEDTDDGDIPLLLRYSASLENLRGSIARTEHTAHGGKPDSDADGAYDDTDNAYDDTDNDADDANDADGEHCDEADPTARGGTEHVGAGGSDSDGSDSGELSGVLAALGISTESVKTDDGESGIARFAAGSSAGIVSADGEQSNGNGDVPETDTETDGAEPKPSGVFNFGGAFSVFGGRASAASDGASKSASDSVSIGASDTTCGTSGVRGARAEKKPLLKTKASTYAPLLAAVIQLLLIIASRINIASLRERGNIYLSVVVIQLLIYVLPGIFYFKLRREGSIDRLDLKPTPPDRIYIAVLAALLLFIISSGFKLAYLGMGIYESRFAQYASYINISTFSDPGDILYMVITFVLIPAVCEELIYRSVIFGEYMRDGYGTVIAAAASTVLYALLHTGLQRLPLYLIIGAMLCIVVRITGSVLMSMVTSVVFGLCDVFTENYISALAHSDYKALVVFTVISLFLLFAVLFFAEAERLYFVLGTSGEKPPARSMREGDIKQLLRSALLSPTVIVCAAVYAVGIVISLI